MSRTLGWLRRPRGRQWLALLCGAAVAFMLLAVETGLSQDEGKAAARVAELRKDPRKYAALAADGKKFLALPEARQEALRKLHQELQGLNPGERNRLLAFMKHYADWLDTLSDTEREQIASAPDAKGRLHKIKEIREQHWLARQPKAVRDQADKLAKLRLTPERRAAAAVGAALARPVVGATVLVAEQTDWRGEWIARLKNEAAVRSQEWQLAFNFWEDLNAKKPMPVQASDFGPEVELYVNEYLKPRLSKAEHERLKAAEGHWPLYPRTLVELADRHPLALPSKEGPNHFTELPKAIQNEIRSHPVPGGKKLDYDNFFTNAKRLEGILPHLGALGYNNPSKALKFNASVAKYARNDQQKWKTPIPFELWPTRSSEMGPAMQEFLDPRRAFYDSLTPDERHELINAQGKWPDYPLKIKHLAEKYGFKPPWQVLPETGELPRTWAKYRVPGPSVLADLGHGDTATVAEEVLPPALDALTAWRRPTPRHHAAIDSRSGPAGRANAGLTADRPPRLGPAVVRP
jgi:hypothetical protein